MCVQIQPDFFPSSVTFNCLNIHVDENGDSDKRINNYNLNSTLVEFYCYLVMGLVVHGIFKLKCCFQYLIEYN